MQTQGFLPEGDGRRKWLQLPSLLLFVVWRLVLPAAPLVLDKAQAEE
jgi:hypothetical protein